MCFELIWVEWYSIKWKFNKLIILALTQSGGVKHKIVSRANWGFLAWLQNHTKWFIKLRGKTHKASIMVYFRASATLSMQLFFVIFLSSYVREEASLSETSNRCRLRKSHLLEKTILQVESCSCSTTILCSCDSAWLQLLVSPCNAQLPLQSEVERSRKDYRN